MPGYEFIDEKELEQITRVFSAGGVLFRHGFEEQRGGVFAVREFEEEFAKRIGAKHALAVTSGTAALRVALAALGVGRGDSVILPAFTFVATAEAIIESGATPICVEVNETLNMDPALVEAAIHARSRAVIAVHMLGAPADMTALSGICQAHGIALLEDVAWGCGGSLHGRSLGTWGDFGAFSFDHAKALTTGEGGMLISDSASLDARARAWHDHGHDNNPQLARWEDSRTSSGFNFRMNELQGAVGLAQLFKLDAVLEGQRQNHRKLVAALAPFEEVVPRPIIAGSMPTCDAAVFALPTRELALAARGALLQAGVGTKILPEALTWHFAGEWSHMPQIEHADGSEGLERSRALLERSIAIPVHAKNSNAEVTAEALEKLFRL